MIDRRHLLAWPGALLIGTRHRSMAGQPVVADTDTAGWPVADLADLGFDPTLGDRLVSALTDYPAVTGVCIARFGRLGFQHYRGGYTATTPVNVRSVTKSVTSTLIGIALQRGDLDSIERTIGEVIPTRIPADADPRVNEISMHSFLTMTSGLWWNHQDDWPMLLAADDWIANTLRQPIVAEQGTTYVYNTGGSHLLGVMLATVVGRPLEDYADEMLFAPLGIDRGAWMRSPQGDVNGGSGLELMPTDMAKIGRLLLQRGRWNDRQLLPETYAGEATTYQSAGDGTGGVPYGYQWWVTDATGYQAFFALGFGGQYIYVVPDLELVVVVAAGFDEQPVLLTSHRPIPEQIVIPSILY